MVILDTNILLYAHMPGFQHHSKVASWLEKWLSSGSRSIGISWQVAVSFIRLSTNSRVFEEPFALPFAKRCLDDLFAHPLVSVAATTVRHWEIYSRILLEHDISGDDVMDARTAAIAVEHGAAIATVDKGFRRFSEYVEIIDPSK